MLAARRPRSHNPSGFRHHGLGDAMTDQESAKRDFSDAIEKCMTSLYHLALRLTQHSVDAEDLVAEAAAKAWAGFGSLEDRSRFRPWMFRILHNCFISRYRRNTLRPVEMPLEDSGSDPEDRYDLCNFLLEQPNDFLVWWADPEKEITSRLLGDDILTALDALPEAYRTTVVLVTVEGFSYDEAAEVLEVPAGTVRSRMKRGRTLLQRQLWQHARDAGLIAAQPSEQSS